VATNNEDAHTHTHRFPGTAQKVASLVCKRVLSQTRAGTAVAEGPTAQTRISELKRLERVKRGLNDAEDRGRTCGRLRKVRLGDRVSDRARRAGNAARHNTSHGGLWWCAERA
jgi:hypothetical protein